jgi:DNA-binding response OmpR family regulator
MLYRAAASFGSQKVIGSVWGRIWSTQVPVIALTRLLYKARRTGRDCPRSLDAGCDAHLTKPVAPQALRAFLRDLNGQAVQKS